MSSYLGRDRWTSVEIDRQAFQVYGFHWNDTENGFKALSGFPKTLPDSIPFKPTAAFAGQDGYPILVSEKGEAAAYDVYLNDEVKLGNETASYLEVGEGADHKTDSP